MRWWARIWHFWLCWSQSVWYERKKEIVMDLNENLNQVVPPVKAEKKHIVLFVIACVLMAGMLSCLVEFAELRAYEPPEESVESQLPGGEILAGVVTAAAFALAEAMMVGGFAVCCVGGGVISALLAMDRKNKPKWLWGASLGLVILFGLIAVGLIAVWILV